MIRGPTSKVTMSSTESFASFRFFSHPAKFEYSAATITSIRTPLQLCCGTGAPSPAARFDNRSVAILSATIRRQPELFGQFHQAPLASRRNDVRRAPRRAELGSDDLWRTVLQERRPSPPSGVPI